MRSVVIVLLGLALLRGITTAGEDQEIAKEPREDAWATTTCAIGALHFSRACPKDAEQVAGYFKDARANLVREFEGHAADKLLGSIDGEVYLHAEPDDTANEYTCTAMTNYKGARAKATFHFLTPSKYDPTHETTAGEPKDANTYFKYVVHEYSTLLLEGLARAKATGWRNAPAWFTQGYEEYLALVCSSEHARTVSLPKYVRIVRDNPKRVDFSFGVEVRDPYVDGAVLLAFMHETFGKERVQKILCSTEDTFGAAMKKELGVTLEAFAEKWAAWLKARQP